MPKLEELYRQLKAEITIDCLKEISVKVIDAYKARDRSSLRRIASSISELTSDPAAVGATPNIDNRSGDGGRSATRAGAKSAAGNGGHEEPLSSLFIRVIKRIHPDRIEAIHRAIDAANAAENYDALQSFRGLIEAGKIARHIGRGRMNAGRNSDAADDFEERYDFDPDDFGFDFDDVREATFRAEAAGRAGAGEEDEDFGSEEERATEFDFVSAVKAEHFGNLDVTIEPVDLNYLEGELSLGGYELRDLDGLQYCVNIISLDLSENEIDNIFEVRFVTHLRELFLSANNVSDLEPLRELFELEILDVSNNDVESIDPILDLPELQFVNISGNPVADRSIPANDRQIAALESRGVVVIL